MRHYALLILLLLVGCTPVARSLPTGEGRPAWFPAARCAEIRPNERAACYKPWTVLLFMAADNDLAPFAYLNLYEMEAKGPGRTASTERSDVVAQLDTPGPGGLLRLHVAQTEERYDDTLDLAAFSGRREQDLKATLLERLPEGTDPPADLRAFLGWGVRAYPAEHYLIVVWGHGQGYGPKAGERPSQRPMAAVPTAKDDPFGGRFRGGLGFDWSPPGYIDIPALKGALSEVKGALGRPVDVYAADACLMQMLEVATELRESARFITSSAYLQDFVGLPYRALMTRLNEGALDGPDTAQKLALALPELYRESLDPTKNPLRGRVAAELRRRFTLSTIATDELRQILLPAMGELGEALLAYENEDLLRKGDLLYIFEHQTGLYGSIQDLGAFLGALSAQLAARVKDGVAKGPVTERLRKAVLRANEAARATVPSFAFGTDYESDGQAALGLRGLSLWLPVSESDYQTRIGDYRQSSFYKGAPAWQRFIERLYQQN